jgi:hypothetical protein
MDTTGELSAFKSINEDIKEALAELDEIVSARNSPFNEPSEKNNELFITILDQLLELKLSSELLE